MAVLMIALSMTTVLLELPRNHFQHSDEHTYCEGQWLLLHVPS
jgi:hypothetical protein